MRLSRRHVMRRSVREGARLVDTFASQAHRWHIYERMDAMERATEAALGTGPLEQAIMFEVREIKRQWSDAMQALWRVSARLDTFAKLVAPSEEE